MPAPGEPNEPAEPKAPVEQQGPVAPNEAQEAAHDEVEDAPASAFPLLETIDLAKAALWPAVAFAAIFSLAGPVGRLVDSLPNVANRVETFTYGNLQLKLTSSGSLPPRSVRRMLEDLTESDIERILVMPPNGLSPDCPGLSGGETTERLVAAGIFDRQHVPYSDACPSSTTLSETGKQLRQYLVDTIFSQVILAAPEPQRSNDVHEQATTDDANATP